MGESVSPSTVVVIESSPPCDKLPPMTAVPRAAAAAACPRASCSSSPSVKARGSTKAESTPRGLAPMAAKSLAAAMSDRQPRSASDNHARRKCTPSTALSTVHTSDADEGRSTAASSPMPTRTPPESRGDAANQPRNSSRRESSLTADYAVRGARLSDKPAGGSWSSRRAIRVRRPWWSTLPEVPRRTAGTRWPPRVRTPWWRDRAIARFAGAPCSTP